MNGQKGRPQTFFWELAVVILFFALAAAVTLRLFAAGSLQSRENEERTGAMLAAVSAAEQIAASESSTVEFAGGEVLDTQGSLELGYDEQWQLSSDAPVFFLKISVKTEEYPQGILCRYEIRAENVSRKELYTLNTARYFPQEEGVLS